VDRETAPPTAARRPIAARRLGISRAAAGWLGRRGVSANAVSLAGMVAGLAAGAALALTARSETPAGWWLAAALLVQARLVANMLDGMVALETGTASALGELMNEMPDRVSDSAVLIGLGYAAGGDALLGWAAALAAMAMAYVRAAAIAAGAPADFGGPMAKQHRMFLVALWGALAALADWPLGPLPEAALAPIVAGAVATAGARAYRAGRALRERRP
jgi:phosphatidylglycerophosphate synthase